MIDEGPSSEDIDRFSDETGYCPNCGAEIWDLVDTCPKCGDHIPEGAQRHAPIEREFRNRWIVLIIILTLLAFLFVFL